MSGALLESLISGGGSASHLLGGIVVLVLYIIIGLLGGIGSILVVPRILAGRWEQIFWTGFLVVVAAFYLSFTAYYGATSEIWKTELIGVAIFLGVASLGFFSRPAIAIGYLMHGAWDFTHSLYGSAVGGLPLSDIPLGYGIFCATFE